MRTEQPIAILLAGCILLPCAAVAEQSSGGSDSPKESVAVATDRADAPAHVSEEPPEPASLKLPRWLVPAEIANPAGRVVAAFELDPAESPAVLPAGHGPVPKPTKSKAVQLASAEHLLAGPPAAGVRRSTERAHAQKLATEANSLGDVNDLIEFCTANSHPEVLQDIAAWAYNRRGELHSEAGDERRAYDDYQRAILIDSNCWQALHNRGVTLASHGRPADALADFNRAVKLNPSLMTAYRNRAELLVSLGRHFEALADFDRAIVAQPGDAALYSGRAMARQRLGQTDAAVRDYNHSITLEPDNAVAFAGRASLYAELGFYEQAVADFAAALACDPLCEPAYRGLAWLLATCPDSRFRDSEKAVESARRMLHLGEAQNSIALDTAAAAHATAGQFDEAVRYEQQAIALARPAQRRAMTQRLALYRQRKPYRSHGDSTAR